MAAAKKLVSVEYEVFGRVQGVFFRKYTEDTARQLGLVGWVRNTPQGTVQGIVQGPEDKIRTMKDWLQNTGSPKSKISHAQFQEDRSIQTLEFTQFMIDRPKRKKNKLK